MLEAHFNSKKLVYTEIKPPPYRFAIVKHRPRDNEMGFGISYSPDTIPMQDRPQGIGKGNTIPILPPWWEYMQKINSPDGYSYNRSIGAMWINIKYDQESINPSPPPRAESIQCGGNFIAYEEETNTHVKLISYDYRMKTDGLKPLVDNWQMKPYTFWKAVAIDNYGKMINPHVKGKGIDAYFPLIRNTELWMNKNDLELFPSPPVGIQYYLRGVNVYGLHAQRGDLLPLLTIANDVRKLHTDWFGLSTIGVIPPAGF
mgnify:FL=1